MMQRARGWTRQTVLSGAAALAIVIVAGLPRGAAAADDPSLTGTSHTDDLVLARQLLMDINETAMMPIDRAAGGADIDLGVLKTQAYNIYTALSVAPHLFPSSTKPVYDKDGAPTPSTAAAAGIWDDFEAFYTQMTDAANLAYDLSQAADIGKFRTLAKQMRVSCDSCHETHMKVYDPNAK